MNSSAINEVLDAQIAAFDARQGERMIEALCAFLHRFVAYPSVQAEIAHALWIVHCHMMDSWDSTPRLAFLSAEPASGKTRALEVTELLVPNPVATVNVTPAYLFRKVGSEGGATILFDEIDTVFGPRAKDNEDIRGLLNAGHRRGAMTGRCAYRGKEVALEELPAYAAVAMAGIGWLPGTVLSRSVVIRMRRRHAGERIEGFRRRIHEIEGWNLRDQISVWAEAAAADVKWPALPPEIADRDADVWEPLLAVADLIGGEWPQRARAAAVALVAQSKEVEPSLGIRLLTDLKVVFADAEAISSKSVLQALHMLLEAPWSDLQGKPLDERRLAYRLKQYGVGPKTIRVGASTCRGYARADLVDLWARYLPPTSETSETSETGELNGSNRDPARQLKGQSTAVSDVSDVSLPGEVGRQCSHCQRTGGELCEASVGGSTIWLHRACMEVFRI